MKRDLLQLRKAFAAIVTGAALVAGAGDALALTPNHFGPVQGQLITDIAQLEQEPATPEIRKRLKTLERANSVLLNTAQDDGTALRSLRAVLSAKAFPDYVAPLSLAASNLVYSFNQNYAFTESLLPQMPPSPDAERAAARFSSVTPMMERLNSAQDPGTIANLLRSARRRLDVATLAVTTALIVPFPVDLSPDTVVAQIDGANFRTSEGLASENVFTAVRSGGSVQITLHAVDGTVGGASGVRAISFSVAAQPGTFRYEIPAAASLACSTGVYSESSVTRTATSGALFVSVNGTEAYGQFEAAGDGFTVARGQFRISVTEADAQ